MRDANVTAEEIDLILVATVTPDQSFPTVSCILQDKLGAKCSSNGFKCSLLRIYLWSCYCKQFVETGAYEQF